MDIHVNPLYALCHYLVSEGLRPADDRNPATAEATGHAARARHLLGAHGIWDVWEQPLASSATVDKATRGLTEAMTNTIDQLMSGLRAVQDEFLARIWPERQDAIQVALATMAQSQANMLDLVWPAQVDVYLVTDCYDWTGAYSHPLTIDVMAHTGLTLCETFLHEATHVADVYTSKLGKESFRDGHSPLR